MLFIHAGLSERCTKMIKEIPGVPKYYVDTRGNVYSKQRGSTMKKIIPWLDTKNNYLMVGLMRDGKRHRVLVHRLVAITFIPNPQNLPEVNHKDKIKTNCSVDNLEWCTRKDNLYDSYSTMSPVRNFIPCALFVNKIKIQEFKSIKDACKFAANNYNAKFSTLYRKLKSRNVEIVAKR